MKSRDVNTVLLITRDRLARADVRTRRKVRVVTVRAEPRPAVDDFPSLVETALRLSDGKGRTFARRLGACLRLAYNLSGGAPGLLPQIQLRRTDRDLRLVVPGELRRSLGDITARRLESAAEAFDLKSVILSA